MKHSFTRGTHLDSVLSDSFPDKPFSMTIAIQKIELPVPGIEQMRTEAGCEGYDFLDTLVEDWASGENRFDGPGEILCGHIDHGQLVAVGGLTRESLRR
jgi:hypothetical protein